jgi:NTP pyrophosphatase (non-canonical NTP hydrolase)
MMGDMSWDEFLSELREISKRVDKWPQWKKEGWALLDLKNPFEQPKKEQTKDYMRIKDFSETNRVRCEAPDGFNHPLSSWSLSDWFTATMGELGEAANVAKKLNRVRDGIPGNGDVTPEQLREQLAEELADTYAYLDLTAQAAGIDLETAVIDKFNKVSERIGYKEVMSRRHIRACGWDFGSSESVSVELPVPNHSAVRQQERKIEPGEAVRFSRKFGDTRTFAEPKFGIIDRPCYRQSCWIVFANGKAYHVSESDMTFV